MKYKILVTGGTGYIGSHTVVELLNQGYEVSIIDDLSNSKPEVLDKIEKITGKRPDFHEIDLCDEEKLKTFFDTNKVDAIIHFAAYKAVGESVQFPVKYYKNNVGGLANVLESMQANTISNLVFSSSCTVYGQPDVLPVTESSPVQKAISPYGFTKQINEEMLSDITKSDEKIKAIALRYFNPIGAHESALIGELPNGIPNNLMPFITQTAAGMRDELMVFGDDYDTPDGSCIRDYIHVVDLAKAHISAVERLLEQKNKTNFETFNIGTGNGFSVLEVIKSFEKTSGEKLNYKIVGRREGDIEKIWAETSLSEKELGWKARLSLDEMTSSAWKWQQNL